MDECRTNNVALKPLSVGISPHHHLDLSGVVCPINYVKTKLKLEEEVKPGEILAITLDNGMPIKSVPPSVEKDGHDIIAIIPAGEKFQVYIQKKGV